MKKKELSDRAMATWYRALKDKTLPVKTPENHKLDVKSRTAVWGLILLVVVLLVWALSMGIGFQTGLTILTIMGFALAVVGLRSPAIGLMAIGMISTLDPVARVYLYTGGAARFNSLNYWLFLVMLLAIPFLLRVNDPHTRLLELFLFMLAVELLVSNNMMKGIQEIIDIASTFGLLVYLARAIEDEQAFYWMGLVSGVAGAAGGLVFNLQINQLPYINPNSLAFMPLSSIFCLCLGFHFAKKLHRSLMIFLLLTAANFVWIFLSGSRGNMLTGLVCLGYILFSMRKAAWGPVLVGLALIAGYFLATQMTNQQNYALDRINLLFDPNVSLVTKTSGRSTLAEAGLEIFKKNPLGIGTGSFREEYATIDSRGRVRPSHSAWITTLAENGIPGILILGSYVVSFLIVGWQKRKQDFLLIGGLVTISLAACFVTKEFFGRGLWMLAAGGSVIMNQEEMIRYLKGNLVNKFTRRYQQSQPGPDRFQRTLKWHRSVQSNREPGEKKSTDRR